jgi:hypothetical protein
MGLASLPDAREAFLDDLLRIRTTETKRAEEAEGALWEAHIDICWRRDYGPWKGWRALLLDNACPICTRVHERRSGEDDEG